MHTNVNLSLSLSLSLYFCLAPPHHSASPLPSPPPPPLRFNINEKSPKNFDAHQLSPTDLTMSTIFQVLMHDWLRHGLQHLKRLRHTSVAGQALFLTGVLVATLKARLLQFTGLCATSYYSSPRKLKHCHLQTGTFLWRHLYNQSVKQVNTLRLPLQKSSVFS